MFYAQAQVEYATFRLVRDVWIPEELQSAASAEARSSSLGSGFPVVREARGNERVWSHLNSAGRAQSSGADLRCHNNIPGSRFSGLDLLPASVVYTVLLTSVDLRWQVT